jgi:hypothetical protein
MFPRALFHSLFIVSPGRPPPLAIPVRSALPSFINRYERGRHYIMRVASAGKNRLQVSKMRFKSVIELAVIAICACPCDQSRSKGEIFERRYRFFPFPKIREGIAESTRTENKRDRKRMEKREGGRKAGRFLRRFLPDCHVISDSSFEMLCTINWTQRNVPISH